MAHYRATIDIQQPREDVFAYLSDFSTTEQWDPGVVEAKRVNGAAVGLGSEFRLVAEFLGRENELTYRIVEYDPPRAVTFLGENAAVISRDRITFADIADGTQVTYDADLALKGLFRIADPLLGLAFSRVGDRALAGLRRTLAPSQPQTLSPVAGRALDGKEYELPGDLPKAAQLPRRRVPPRAAAPCGSVAGVADRPRAAPRRRRRLRATGARIRLLPGAVVHRRWHDARDPGRGRSRPHDHRLHRRRQGPRQPRSCRNRHDRSPDCRALRPDLGTRDRRL